MNPGSQKIEEFLLECGAGQLPRPGGTLYERLIRVAALLADWGADEDLRVAALCHACYGTDGYRHSAALATRHGAALRQFFAGARARLTEAAWQAWSQPPGPYPAALTWA